MPMTREQMNELADIIIDKLVCKQKGIDFIHFYNEEGKKLEKILGVI
jgi:hypothetical protein